MPAEEGVSEKIVVVVAGGEAPRAEAALAVPAGALADVVDRRRAGWAQALFELAAGGDEEAILLAGRVVDILGTAIGSAVNVLDIDAVVLGGGIAPGVLEHGERLRVAVGAALFARSVGEVRIVGAQCGSMAGAIGAARLAMLASNGALP